MNIAEHDALPSRGLRQELSNPLSFARCYPPPSPHHKSTHEPYVHKLSILCSPVQLISLPAPPKPQSPPVPPHPLLPLHPTYLRKPTILILQTQAPPHSYSQFKSPNHTVRKNHPIRKRTLHLITHHSRLRRSLEPKVQNP